MGTSRVLVTLYYRVYYTFLSLKGTSDRHLEMLRGCVAVPVSTRSFLLFLSTVETSTATQPRQISRWRPAGNSVIKTNRFLWTIYRELSNLSCWCRQQVEENSYLRLILFDSRGSSWSLWNKFCSHFSCFYFTVTQVISVAKKLIQVSHFHYILSACKHLLWSLWAF